MGSNPSSSEDGFKPILKRGPRDRQTVRWVAEVKPDLYRRLIGFNRLFIGFMSCKVRDFKESTKCSKCQKYGHSAAHCKSAGERCAKYAAEGHNSRTCTLTTMSDAKCVNCGMKGVTANHKSCAARARALARTLRRTDYGFNPQDASTDPK